MDDPHEEFRAKPALQEPSVDRYHGDRNTAERPDDETLGINIQKLEEKVHYVPVSLLSTPPTIQTPQKPYGEIVNKDFNELFKKKQRPLGTKRHRSQHRGKISAGKSTRNSVYPLGNPYYRTPSTQYGPNRLEGVLGPPNPQLDHRPSHAFDSRSSSSWLPAESYNVHASGREIDYRQEPVIFHVRDSGELYQQSYPQSEAGWELNAEEGDRAWLEPEVRRDGGSRYDPHYAQPTQRPYQGMMPCMWSVCATGPFLYVPIPTDRKVHGCLPYQCEASLRRSRHVDEWLWPQSGDMQADYFSQRGQIQMTFCVQAPGFEVLPSRWRRWATRPPNCTSYAPRRCLSISNTTFAKFLQAIFQMTLVSSWRSS